VDEWFLEALVAAPWVKERYHLSADDGQPVAPGGQLILAKQPLRSLSVLVMPGRQRRTLMIAELDIRGRRLRVATTHLESFLEDGPVRARQLDGIFDLLKQADDAVLMGDLNFGDGDQPETAHLDPSYLDLWRELLPKDPGFTWNMRENPLARIGAFVGEPDRRLDRILLRSDAWRPRSIALIGDHAVATRPLTRDDRRLIEMPNRPPVAGTEDIEVFPSDHYGLTATLVPR
ncbi:MAG: endonuclease/exonuclease/phosphatase family protein, partial [Myxococcales bacterium]|nr:endonuclease/exonuclease/phosphatase family protein [Myxococcales bacterium]